MLNLLINKIKVHVQKWESKKQKDSELATKFPGNESTDEGVNVAIELLNTVEKPLDCTLDYSLRRLSASRFFSFILKEHVRRLSKLEMEMYITL